MKKSLYVISLLNALYAAASDDFVVPPSISVELNSKNNSSICVKVLSGDAEAFKSHYGLNKGIEAWFADAAIYSINECKQSGCGRFKFPEYGFTLEIIGYEITRWHNNGNHMPPSISGSYPGLTKANLLNTVREECCYAIHSIINFNEVAGNNFLATIPVIGTNDLYTFHFHGEKD